MRLAATGLFAVLAELAGPPPAARACSLASTYIEPTRVELVAKADLVVVASAKKETDGAGEPEVELEVARVIKGRGVAAGDRIRVAGMLSSPGGKPAPSRLSDIRPAHGCWPGGVYSSGIRYLVILRSRSGGWDTLSSEVEEPVWLGAVEEYARVAALADPAGRRAALDALVTRGEQDSASPIDRMISYDVELHLVTATPHKSFVELLPMLTFEDIPPVAGMLHLPRRDEVVLAIGVGGDPAAREWIRASVRQARRGRPLVDQYTLSEAIAAWLEEVPDPGVLAEVGELYLYLARRRPRSDSRWSLMSVLIDQASDRHQDLMIRALVRADRDEAELLASWFARHPIPAALEHVASRVGTAYRRNHLLSQALAAMGDGKVVAWARRAWRRKRSGALPLYVLALSPRAEADAEAGKLIAAGGEQLAGLIDGYGWARHERAAARLKEIGARRLTAAQQDALDRTLASQARLWLAGSD